MKSILGVGGVVSGRREGGSLERRYAWFRHYFSCLPFDLFLLYYMPFVIQQYYILSVYAFTQIG